MNREFIDIPRDAGISVAPNVSHTELEMLRTFALSGREVARVQMIGNTTDPDWLEHIHYDGMYLEPNLDGSISLYYKGDNDDIIDFVSANSDAVKATLDKLLSESPGELGVTVNIFKVGTLFRKRFGFSVSIDVAMSKRVGLGCFVTSNFDELIVAIKRFFELKVQLASSLEEAYQRSK